MDSKQKRSKLPLQELDEKDLKQVKAVLGCSCMCGSSPSRGAGDASVICVDC